MLFHTWPFALFFLIVYPLYLLLCKSRPRGIFLLLDWLVKRDGVPYESRPRLIWLLLVSYSFYAFFSPAYIVIMLYSTAVDYLALLFMARGRLKRLWLTVSITNNLALLGAFKYLEFITNNVNSLLGLVGICKNIPHLNILLPVGLSFYVFQSMGYVIDVYQGRIPCERSFFFHAAFVAFFPRLLAGPIERARNLLPQLHKMPKVSMQNVTDGMSLFIVGLFKKVALADYLALYVDNIYAAPEQYQSPALILATFLFCWQIYFDFSGYTDMARGIARMMGINLMLNFNNPYLSTSLGEFWGRWHISLSSWFKDYVYIPLGGNLKGTFNTYRNMFLTMVISGLWHGAAWTFVIWGAVHAFGRFITREMERTPFYREKVPKLVKQLFVFTFVTFAWIFFRADSIGDAWLVITRIFSSGWANPYCPVWALIMVFSVWLYQFMYESKFKWIFDLAPVRIGLVAGMIFYLAVFAPSSEQGFIYLQF